VTRDGAGVVVVLQQHESTADLVQRLRRFQDPLANAEPVSASRGRVEMRSYGLGSQILADLGVGKMRVMGHAMKAPGMSGFGLEIVEYVEDSTSNNKDKKALR